MRVRVAHISLQFSDNDKQHTSDIEKIFDRAVDRRVAWLTGTESGPGSGNTAKELVRVAKEHGYRPWVPAAQAKGAGQHSGSWLVVRDDLVLGNWKQGFLPGIPGSAEFYKEQGLGSRTLPRWGPRGLVNVSFDSLPELGHISVGAAHYLTGARSPKGSVIKGVNHWEENEKLAGIVGDWFREQGAGKGLAFYGGDQNMDDSKNEEPQGDTFFGANVTSVQDELLKWENTGHGPIDVIATYNKDGRVTALKVNVLDDSEFRLATDHFYLEAVLNVEPLKL